MNKTEKQIAAAAGRFAKRWAGKGYEKGQSQVFWLELLTEVFGIEEPSTIISFEDQVQLDHTSFIDGYIDRTHTMIEQKSLGKDLLAPIKQSDGKELTPFQQAQRYSAGLPYSKRPRWIVTCNFETFLVYDMEHPKGEPFEIQLADLGKEYYRLRFLVETNADHLDREMQVSMQAGVIVGKLYEALLKEYKDPTNPESLRSLNVLCVRLVFCLYSEDAGIFGKHDMFHDYLARYATMDMRNALIRLFQILNTPLDERDPYLQDDLAAFPYASGGLFEGDIEIPRLNDEIRDLLLRHASLDFDWSEISPTIFGAVFESTLNPETRRSGGMHYTSVENIHINEGQPHLPDYIMGNPPFIGKSFQSPAQKEDMELVFNGIKNYGNLDYVASWYKKCADFMEGTDCRAALVSTNSICQGIAVPPLWNYLISKGIYINFAYPSFKWNNESNDAAAVHCVILGFSYHKSQQYFYYEKKDPNPVSNINPYLVDANTIIIDDIHDPICDVPKSAVGSFPTDGGHLVIQEEELSEYISKEPEARKYIRLFIGPYEFINSKKRYCLWLKGCSPAELRSMPITKERVSSVRLFRLNSKKKQTQRRADYPHLFAEDRQPETSYILFPRTSSEKRKYLPIGFLSSDVIAGDTIIVPNATLYHFGVLTSIVHNAWMRVVCGRMKSDYRYSGTLVYNNFPWPEVDEQQRQRIAQTAQAILDARALYPDSSLADLYDPVTMPPELLKAHRENDRAVMAAYGFAPNMPEPEIVARLFTLYNELTTQQ